MKNVLRTLLYGGQVSLTLADTTELVAEGARRHGLSSSSAYLFGKALSAMTFMSACLKEPTGEISLSLKGKGESGEIAVSGNQALFMRGYIENTALTGNADELSANVFLGTDASITIIRDDGYNRPFVGACALPENAGVDEGFEEYFRISEQLPTRIKTEVFYKDEKCLFAGVVAVQPLPFADEETLKKVKNLPLEDILKDVKALGIIDCANKYFERSTDVFEVRTARYQCNCSRQYLTRVLVSLGETQLREIIRQDGAVRVHCHYCNTDYAFTDEDADVIFSKE